LGRSAGTSKQGISDETASEIDKEVKEILGNCYKTAKEVLENNIDALNKMSQALMDYETLDADQIDDIMAGGDPRAPKSPEEQTPKGPKKSSVGDTAEQN
jgi:cell division protease FtsH